MRVEDEGGPRSLSFRTNVDDWIVAGPDHPMRFETGASEGLKPYVHVRAGLWARVNRALFYDLADLGEIRTIGGTDMFGVASGGLFFPMAPAADIGALS